LSSSSAPPSETAEPFHAQFDKYWNIKMHNEGLVIARLFLGVPFVVWGILKLRGGEAKLVPGLQALGLPDAVFFAYLIGFCELVGGLAVVVGYPVRTASSLLGLWCLVTGYDAHRGNTTELLKNVTMAGGFFALAVAGAGSISLFGGAPTGLFAYLP
jgi:putative oxidoreductase